jgi:hypothetical protein
MSRCGTCEPQEQRCKNGSAGQSANSEQGVNAVSDWMEDLGRLGELMDSGLLTPEEFEKQKALIVPSGSSKPESGPAEERPPFAVAEQTSSIDQVSITDEGIDIPDGVDDQELGLRLLSGRFLNQTNEAAAEAVPGSWITEGSIADQVCRIALLEANVVEKLPQPIRSLIKWQNSLKPFSPIFSDQMFATNNVRSVRITDFGEAYTIAVPLLDRAIAYERDHKGFFTQAYGCEPHQLPERLATTIAQLDARLSPVPNHHYGDGGTIEFWESAEIKTSSGTEIWRPRPVSKPMRSLLDPVTYSPVDLILHSWMNTNKAANFYQGEVRDYASQRRATAASWLSWELAKSNYRSERKLKAAEKELLTVRVMTGQFLDFVGTLIDDLEVIVG